MSRLPSPSLSPDAPSATSAGGSRDDLEQLRAENERLRRERDELQGKLEQIAEVIGAPNAQKVVHDLRNVMNELVLLRKLTEDLD